MKKLALLLVILLSLAASETRFSLQGQRNVHAPSWIHFDPGSLDGDSTQKIHVSSDTIWADSSGTWKQISGTVDSCSYPFFLTDWSGNSHPVWLQYISPLITSTRVDSNQISFEIEKIGRASCRERV